MTREIHQVIVSAAPGDAITNAALEWRTLLRREGPSEIFSCYRDDALVGEELGELRRVVGEVLERRDVVVHERQPLTS